MIDIAIIGCGVAGMTAAIYARRAGKTVTVFENDSIGGQISKSPKVENYPAIKSISGEALSNQMFEQMIDLEAKFVPYEVKEVKKNIDNTFTLYYAKKEILAKAIIIATGVKHKKLLAENIEKYEQISYCAVCDGAFYSGKDVAVIGDANTAFQYAIMLSSYCKKVNICMWSEKVFADKALENIVKSTPNIEIFGNMLTKSFEGKDNLQSITFENNGVNKKIDVEACFVAIGHIPNVSKFKDLVALDKSGFVIAGEDCKTNIEGIFVAGDCRTKAVRQVTTANNDGAISAINAGMYIDALIIKN